MALHYQVILAKFLFCPVPLAFGEYGTGKTSSGLAMLAAYPSQFYSKGSLEKYTNLCSTNNFPLGSDDPRSRGIIGDLTISLFNGAKATTIKHGDSKSSCMAVICANFTTAEQEK